MASQRRRLAQKGVSLVVGTAAMVLLIPSAGLSIDAALLYYTKTRLQGAVDGAALGAARALSLGSTPAQQTTNAKQDAVNWFYANFPTTLWETSNTQMDQTMVTVQDDPNNTRLRDVSVSANTTVPTIFMRWFNMTSTVVAATGTASRRDVVAMMIIDRSGSMNSNNGCTNMRSAAKLFTGQFAAGRDQIGMVEFGDTSWVDSSPNTDFQTVLGYTSGASSGSGLIDTISCGDNTGTAQAISLAYNELYKMSLPGAFNFLMFFTDGIPNSVTLNFKNVMLSTSGCRDSNGTAISAGGNMSTHPRSWTPGWTLPSGYFNANIPAGPIGVIASDDPSSSGSYGVRMYQGTSQSNTGHGTIGTGNPGAPGCSFAPSSEPNYVNDFQRLPPTDVWGNTTVDNTYNALTTDANGNIVLNGTADTGTPLNGNNLVFHLAARNAAANAAYKARTNATIPATIFGIGLGGTSQAPPGYDFMQRITNDPNGDLYNSPPLYNACSTEPTCTTYGSPQAQGVFIFSSDPTKLQAAFLDMASQILRLAK
jgi:Flp pilus assembly protein TadG